MEEHKIMINNIKIKNFKSFSEKQIDFSYMTVFSGLNSSGKSTVINSILLPMQLEKNKKLFLNGIYFNLGTFKDIFHQWADEDSLTVEYVYNEAKSTISMDYEQSIEDNDYVLCRTDGNLTKLKQKIRYIAAERISPKIFFKGDTPDTNAEFIGVNGELCVSVLSSLKNINIPINSMRHKKSSGYAASASSLLANVNAWLDDISPGVTVTSELLAKIRVSTLSFGYENEATMNSVGAVNVGFGLTYVLPVIVAGLLCKKGDVFIIENPEAHLHPSGQRHIGEFLSKLAASGVQVIIETHSDHIINGIRLSIKNRLLASDSSKFIFISKEKVMSKSTKRIQSNVSYIDISNEGKILSAPQGFFDEWEEALYKLL